VPRVRGRWFTSTDSVAPPFLWISAGRKRCMWSNTGSSSTAERRTSFRPQPVSGVASPSRRERTPLAMREETRLSQLSRRFLR